MVGGTRSSAGHLPFADGAAGAGGAGGEGRLVPMPGVEVQATPWRRCCYHRYLHAAPLPLGVGVRRAAGAADYHRDFLLRPLRAGFVAVVLVAAGAVATYRCCGGNRVWLPLVPLLAGGIVSYTNGAVYMYFAEERARQRLRRSWQQRGVGRGAKVILTTRAQRWRAAHRRDGDASSTCGASPRMCHTLGGPSRWSSG